MGKEKAVSCEETASSIYPDFRSVLDEEAAQLLASRWMTQFPQCLRLDLTDALPRHVELFTHFFQRVVGVHVDTEPHPKHLGFTRRQLRKYRVGGFAQRFHRRL